MLPFVAVLVPAAFHVQGLYRLRRGRTRVDDFFAVFVGTILAVVLGVFGTLVVGTYYLPEELKDAGVYEVSQLGWALFLVINVVFTYLSRELVREALERRWKAGIGLKRVLIAGAGDLGRMVADKVLEHRELGFKVARLHRRSRRGDHIGYRGLPLLGTLGEADDIIRRERIDHLYVALPLEEHVKMLGLVEATNREGVDLHVVPDLLQFIALRARLENLDGVPIISLNDVPLRGFNSLLKRRSTSRSRARAAHPARRSSALIALLIRRTSNGPVFYRQERMGLDGKAFQVYKFRSMHRRAPRTRPARSGRATTIRAARRSAAGCAASTSTSCRSSGTCCAATCRSSARARSALTSSSSSSTASRNTCCATRSRPGITGWAQVNGWRGNTSLEKRIEYDLYYIENWSVGLDLKIMWLTLVRAFQKHA